MYHNLNTITIFSDRLRHNLGILQRLSSDITCIPVVKSNAYGHGLRLLAKEWNTYDIPFICVDSLFEAYELQKYGYKKDILIMGFIDPRDIPKWKSQFHYACSEISYALAVTKRCRKAKLHLFLDTGMHREGIQNVDKQDIQALQTIQQNIVGVMTHLAAADNAEVSQKQIESFQAQIENLKQHKIVTKFQHICASG